MPFKHFNPTRTWGSRYDTLPTSPPTSFETTQDDHQPSSQEVNASLNFHVQDDDEKRPNASIFVGSLPSGVDPSELARLLTGHFSEYTGVKGVKVIRDSKGGVCAFVQCENTASASVFLQNLQSSPPKPFLGRILRYEPARAFRTLLISYKAPSRVIVANRTGEDPPGTISGFRDLELPYAMRLWRPKNTKFHRVIYNAEAIEAELYSRTHPKQDADFRSERFVYLQPLKFDAESILKLTKYFGPLENFSELTRAHELIKASPNGDLTPECYPSPHNLPRTKGMDTNCWEVKWIQRDDCVAALTALRKVPHLSVSWAHHPQTQTAEQCRDLRVLVNHTPPTQIRVGNPQPYVSPDSASPLVSSPGDVPTDRPTQQGPTAENDNLIVHKRGSVFDIDRGKNWANPAVPPGFAYKGPPASSAAIEATEERGLEELITTRIDWAEASFPSFLSSECSPNVNWSAWENVPSSEKDISPPSIIASRPTRQVLTPKSSQASSPVGLAYKVPTSGLVTSPATPGMTVSKTPITPVSQIRGGMVSNDKTKCGIEGTSNGPSHIRQLDPMALFVGGLETHGADAWTEEKVYATFGRFGGLEYVKFVRPLYGSAAFAFVKYNNTESPGRAILEEHNRVYSGRALKVQLRDINPPRSQWKHDRGRGRFSHHHANRKVMLSVRPGDNTPEESGPTVRRGFAAKIDENNVASLDTASAHEINEYKRGESTQSDKESLVLMTRSTEKYREWYDTPPVGSPLDPRGALSRPITPSLPVPAPYSAPGYYPMPWPYPYAGHCQVPYCGPYPGYAFPSGPIPPFAPTPPGSDANGPVAGSHLPWPNMVYNAYPPYFCPPPPPTVEHQAPAVPQGFQIPHGPRAPLVPSGFIQSGQGTLIAVYPPDALNQYMAAQNNDGKSGNQPINTAAVGSAPQAYQELGPSYDVGSHANSNPTRLYTAPNPPWNPMPPPVMPLGVVTNTIPPSGNVNALRVGEHHNKTGVNGPPPPNLWGNQKAYVDHLRRGRTQNENLNGNMEGVSSHQRYSQAMHDWNQRSARD